MDRINKLERRKKNREDSGGDDLIGTVIHVRYCARDPDNKRGRCASRLGGGDDDDDGGGGGTGGSR